MKIMTALNIGYPVVGGAQITHQTYLKRLAREFDHACIYLDAARTPRPIMLRPVRRDYFRDAAELRAKIEFAPPELLIAGFTLIQDVLKIAKPLGVPVIGWMNSFEYCPPTDDEIVAWQLTHGHRYPTPAERDFVFEHAAALVVNSHFLKARFARTSGITPRVIYPAFDPRALGVKQVVQEQTYILGVCGYPHKGAHIFLELARRFPQEQFLLAGAILSDLAGPFQAQNNIIFSPFRPMQELFARAKLVLVPSQWDEPFGRIAIEAMANGIPTLVSRVAGLGEIVENGVQGVAEYRSTRAWVEQVRDVLEDANLREENLASGRTVAARFTGLEPIAQLDALARELVRPLVHESGMALSDPALANGAVRSVAEAALIGRGERNHAHSSAPVVQLVGNSSALSAFALVNRRIADGLRGRGYPVHETPETGTFVPEATEVVIHHDYAQEFRSVLPPSEGKLVAIRTWDFGPFPPTWVERINADYDQLWVHSKWVKQQAIASGIPARRVRVIPLGVDPSVLQPDGATMSLATDKRFKFLFVGSSVPRKGFNILLAAYQAAFTRQDDVALVVKDNPQDIFYKGAKATDEIEQFQADGQLPTLVYLNSALEPEELASLYRACNVGVFPYRAEGFALPIAEAMACGLPCIVPRFGACLDYCSRETSFFVKPRRIQVPVAREFVYNSLGFSEWIPAVALSEVPIEKLARRMREVYELSQTNPTALATRGDSSARLIRTRFTWDHSLDAIERALDDLARSKIPLRMRRQRRANVKQKRIFEAARAMYLGLPHVEGLSVRAASHAARGKGAPGGA